MRMCGFALNNRKKGEVILDLPILDWGFDAIWFSIRNPKYEIAKWLILEHRIPG